MIEAADSSAIEGWTTAVGVATILGSPGSAVFLPLQLWLRVGLRPHSEGQSAARQDFASASRSLVGVGVRVRVRVGVGVGVGVRVRVRVGVGWG